MEEAVFYFITSAIVRVERFLQRRGFITEISTATKRLCYTSQFAKTYFILVQNYKQRDSSYYTPHIYLNIYNRHDIISIEFVRYQLSKIYSYSKLPYKL